MPKRTEHTKMPEHTKMSLPFTVRFCKNCGETVKAKELGTNNDVCPICDSRDFEEVVLTKDTKVHCVYCTKETTIEEVLKHFPRLQSKDAILIKFADRLSNLSRMEAWNKDRQEQYLRKSKFWNIEISEGN